MKQRFFTLKLSKMGFYTEGVSYIYIYIYIRNYILYGTKARRA